MAHHRKLLGAAVALNTAICAGEALAGLHAQSLSLLMDSVHNLSDELALVLLWLAFFVSRPRSRTFLRAANGFNALGLCAVSGLLGWQAVLRLLHPLPVGGLVPIVTGLAAAVGNGGVAWLLWGPGREHTAIRLAYVHNRGDVVMSCAPVVAGVLVTLSGWGIFDAAMALGVAVWMFWSTLRELLVAPAELLWPDTLSCGHAPSGRVSFRTRLSV